ncbi:MAG: VWA domain-containing protein [bacterium]
MRLESPAFLVLLVFVPLVLAVPIQRVNGTTLVYSTIQRLKAVGGTNPRRRLGWLGGLRMVVLALLVLAASRPQLPGARDPLKASGIDIMLSMDVSGSMRGLDFFLDQQRVSRLEALKHVVREFVLKRKGDRIGVVIFGEAAFTKCPLTLNYDILLDLLDRVQVGEAGDTTALGNGLARAVQRLKDTDAKSRIVILLTDGVSNAGNITIDQAITTAKGFGVKVYTIGIGTGKDTTLTFVDSTGVQRTIKQEVKLDEPGMKRIAEETGGRYFRAADTAELTSIYAQIDQLERSDRREEIIQSWRELFPYVLFVAALLLIAEAVLARTRFLKVP